MIALSSYPISWISQRFAQSKKTQRPIWVARVDNVEHPSWQAQLKGRKKWVLQPPPECYYHCGQLEVTVEQGEIICRPPSTAAMKRMSSFGRSPPLIQFRQSCPSLVEAGLGTGILSRRLSNIVGATGAVSQS
ncbi:unnamed protein product [Timema podura]|uniref:Uncharacterized protein n=1 Tax=Timema podura TaxID=61482 RepID=A0ABN7NIE6_TIMPD|nr:unnamed protein product [Timema podura]